MVCIPMRSCLVVTCGFAWLGFAAAAACRRVLSAATRKPGRPSSQIDSTDSRPSTAASLLSLKQQQQQQGLGRKSPSRPGTGSIAARAFTAAAAAAPPDSGSGGARAGGTSAALCAFNRTLLLELVQQDDVSWGVLSRGSACVGCVRLTNATVLERNCLCSRVP